MMTLGELGRAVRYLGITELRVTVLNVNDKSGVQERAHTAHAYRGTEFFHCTDPMLETAVIGVLNQAAPRAAAAPPSAEGKSK